MSNYRLTERRAAIQRGLDFIYGIACNANHFAEWGSDMLSCFYFIAVTSKDRALSRAALSMGKERAGRWRRDYRGLPAKAGSEALIDYLFGSSAADRLGFRDSTMKKEIAAAVKNYSATDLLCFDPRVEPPPSDVPQECSCGVLNKRGTKVCRRCKKRLRRMTRYCVWYDALVRTYTAERYGMTLGARYSDVLRWLPSMRPYVDRENGSMREFYDTAYAITHVVYTLNDYSLYRLSPRWLPHEYEFLIANLKEAMHAEDAEMLGEFMDALKAFGLTDRHPLIRTGVDYLLAHQNPDGSWGSMSTRYVYRRYHPTWTALDGLRDYAWRGQRLSFPRLRPLLEKWARA